MIRKHKKYSRPRKLYDSERIAQENILLERYGLKNKREIWKAEAKVRYFRTRAKGLITSSEQEQQTFFGKLNSVGLKISSIADVLALTKEDLLKRRLPTILVEKKLARSPQEARQMIVHKRIMVDGGVVSSPSYLVKTVEESRIMVRSGKINISASSDAGAKNG